MKSRIFIVFFFVLIVFQSFVSSQEIENTNDKQKSNKDYDKLSSMSIEELMNIEIETASRKKEQLHKAPATMIVTTDRQIKERVYGHLDELIMELPGVDIVNVHGKFPTIWAPRGSYGDENKRTLLMIDGIVENNLFEGNVLGGPQYSLHNVKQVETIYGPASALYGANAFSGIINIITKSGKDINGIEVQTGIGSNFTRFAKFMVGSVIKEDFDFSVSGSIYSTDGPVFTEQHPDFSESYVDKAYSVMGKFSYKDITFGFSRFDRPMGSGLFANSPSVYYGLPLHGYNDNEGRLVKGSNAHTTTYGEKGSLQHSVTNTVYLKTVYSIFEKQSTSLKIGGKTFFRYTELADDSYVYGVPDPLDPEPFYKFPYNHKSHTIGAEIFVDYNIDKNNDLIVGFMYEQSNVQYGYTPWQAPVGGSHDWTNTDEPRKYNIYHNYSVFSQYNLKTELLNYTAFTFGARYDYNNVYGDTFNPRGGIVNQPFEDLTMKLLVGTAFRAPTSKESFSSNGGERVPNPDLEPEKSITYELGFAYQIIKSWLFETNIYRNEFSDMIYEDVDQSSASKFINVGKAVMMGVEIKNIVDISRDFSFFTSFSFQRAKQNVDLSDNLAEENIPNVAKYKGNLGFTYYILDYVSLYTIGKYVGDRTTPDTNPRDKVDQYFVLDMALTSRKFFRDSLSFSIRVNNVLNSIYADPGIRSGNGENYPTQMESEGRNLVFKLTYTL